jgi:hypothetical protein
MTLEDFVGLPIDEQAQHVRENGRYLMNREGQRTVINLYAVGTFYVEVCTTGSRTASRPLPASMRWAN